MTLTTNAALRMSKEAAQQWALVGPGPTTGPTLWSPLPQHRLLTSAWSGRSLPKGVARGAGLGRHARVRWYHCDGYQAGPTSELLARPVAVRAGPQGSARTVFSLGDENIKLILSRNQQVWPVCLNLFSVHTSLVCRLFCGEWLSFGAPDLAVDQKVSGCLSRLLDLWSLCSSLLHVFGDARCRSRVTWTQPRPTCTSRSVSRHEYKWRRLQTPSHTKRAESNALVPDRV